MSVMEMSFYCLIFAVIFYEHEKEMPYGHPITYNN